MLYNIGQLAKLAGVTPRTLRHYHKMGLLVPTDQAKNKYRRYGDTELLRLQQIMFLRELDFPLEHIKQVLDQPDFDYAAALKDQKQMLKIKIARLQKLIATIEQTINKMKGKNMTDDKLYDNFADDELDQYKEEARQRWGHTEAYKQSMARTKNWTKADVDKVKNEYASIAKGLAENMAKGFDSPEVQALVARQFNQINFFYDCTAEIYRGLAKMYVEDPRFAKLYTDQHPDLPKFLEKAINYFCDHRQWK